MTPQDLTPQIDEIRSLLETQLRVRGATLDKQIHRAGRLLPRKIRAEAAFLVQANLLVQNPKLARMINPERVGQAHLAVSSYLNAIDPKERAKTRALNYLGLIAFNVLLLVGALIAILVWRGIV
jgi:hypothetical protein